MEKLLSKKLLAKIKDESVSKSASFLKDVKAMQTRRKHYSEISIFLSHKHGENEIIEQAVALFTSLGVTVYMDWQDYGIPKTTDGSTAMRIKNKIRENDKFILLATEDAIQSKWCNWELGYGDATKYPNNIAVMPITNSEEEAFSGTEYLQTYPLITSGYFYNTGNYYVEYGGIKENLRDWLYKK